ncbi:MAG: glycosyltransferase [Bacteroidales bacterium]
MKIVIIGLSITSSWGNGHATTFRSLVKGLHRRGHQVDFLERDVPWYASQRDMKSAGYCNIFLYQSLEQLKSEFREKVAEADLVVVGSYVPEGVEVGKWVTDTAGGITAFYDIDTPVTMTKLDNKDYEYLHPDLIPHYDLYLTFAGGEVPDIFMSKYGSPHSEPLYCSVDPDLYYPEDLPLKWDLGYLGTYSPDRQPPLDDLLTRAAAGWPMGRFVVAGPGYPDSIIWPQNVERIDHLSPPAHREFYNRQRFTLNITRKDMIQAGYSPSVRLFEAAACGTPIISDYWEGLDSFFKIGHEILISATPVDTLHYLKDFTSAQRSELAEKARKKVLELHTGEHRALEIERYVSKLAADTVR